MHPPPPRPALSQTAGSAIESEGTNAATDQQKNGTSHPAAEAANGAGKGKASANASANAKAKGAVEGDANGAASAASAPSHSAGSGSSKGEAGQGQQQQQQQPLVPRRAVAPHPPMEAYHPVWSESVWMYYDTVRAEF